MATKPRAKPPPDDPVESARFIETAKALVGDGGETAFKQAVKRLLPKRKSRARTSGT